MGIKRWKVAKPCVNQETGQRLRPGEIVAFQSDFEIGRHLAEHNIVPYIEQNRETQTIDLQERRRRK